jgi:hypothetical protein
VRRVRFGCTCKEGACRCNVALTHCLGAKSKERTMIFSRAAQDTVAFNETVDQSGARPVAASGPARRPRQRGDDGGEHLSK